MAQTTSTQLGEAAIAHPNHPNATLPPPAPELHHLKNDADNQKSSKDIDANNTQDEDLDYHDLPPFPSDAPTVPLLRISLQKLLEQDRQETQRLWDASRDIGFFYLDLRQSQPSTSTSKRDSGHEDTNPSLQQQQKQEGIIDGTRLLQDADSLFKLGEQLFRLPTEEKIKYDLSDRGSYFGYKGLGAGVVDAKGTPDRNEFYNVSKDDVLGLSSETLPAPDLLKSEQSRALLGSFMLGSHAVVSLILQLLNEKLGLPDGRLEGLHRLTAVSGDQVRWVSTPPQPEDDRKKALGEHTDFGSITLLHNRLGGLQVLPPNSSEWAYVRPLRHHCVVNLGDAMVKFTAGVLRSNIHRVVNPPGLQGDRTRMSLVYFARPEDDVVLKTLEGSEVIERARRVTGKEDDVGQEISAKEWILRRAFARRAGGDWEKSGGTEGERVGK